MTDKRRVETGALKINDDWTGIFIRGDDALMRYLPSLKKLSEGKQMSAFDRSAINNLTNLLSSCVEHECLPQRIKGTLV